MRIRSVMFCKLAALFLLLAIGPELFACTGITLKAKDGTVLYGRTLEWGSFDMQSRLLFIPRGEKFVGGTPDNKPGYTWKSRYGVVAIDALHKNLIIDGMNEHGLAVGLFYHPGFAKYAAYQPAEASSTIGPGDVAMLLLTTCQTIEEVKESLSKVHVAPVIEPDLGIPPPIHLMVTQPDGEQMVIEFHDGEIKFFKASLGVITNAPDYDWHITNLRNYVNLSAVAIPDTMLEEIDFTPLGGGSGMIGLPGDFTPPSRFIRAVAFSQTARKTSDGPDAMTEAFRILDNFNVPLGAAEGNGDKPDSRSAGMKSATQWTSASDTRNCVLYYHTQFDRRVRKVDIGAIDFDKLSGGIQALPLDAEHREDLQEVKVPTAK